VSVELLRYRLLQPTIALFLEEGRQVAHTVPTEEVIEAERIDGEGFVEVRWKEKTILMFAQDLRARTEELP
jgi:hypothetical protein